MATRQTGFTLLEVLAAVAILAIAMLVLIRSQTMSISNVQEVQNYERALFITENQLHWTWIDLNEAEHWDEYRELSGEDGDYRWSVRLEEAQMAVGNADKTVTLLRMIATTTWPKGRGQGVVQLESHYLWGEED